MAAAQRQQAMQQRQQADQQRQAVQAQPREAQQQRAQAAQARVQAQAPRPEVAQQQHAAPPQPHPQAAPAQREQAHQSQLAETLKELLEEQEDWASGDSAQILLTDSGLVHGTVAENLWLEPGEDYACETLPPNAGQTFRLTYSPEFAGKRGWKCKPTIPRLLNSLGFTSTDYPSKNRPLGLRVSAVMPPDDTSM